MRLTTTQRTKYGLRKIRQLTSLPKVGGRIQYFVRRDSGEIIRRTCKVIPLPDGFIPSTEKVYAAFDDGLPNNGFFCLWDFALKIRSESHSPSTITSSLITQTRAA